MRPHGADELSRYSIATSDIEYLFPLDETRIPAGELVTDLERRLYEPWSSRKLAAPRAGFGHARLRRGRAPRRPALD